jgi:putative FmdB family regulatory protein
MPIYCFHCKACSINFEEICRWEAVDKIKCSKCSKKPERLNTRPSAVIFADPRGTSKEDDFDYVAKTNYENSKTLRRVAEANNTHKHEYNAIDDISKYEGKIADIDPFTQQG